MLKRLKEYFTETEQTVPQTHVLKPFLFSNRPPVLVPTYEYLVSQKKYLPKKEIHHPSARLSTFVESPVYHTTDNYETSYMRSLPERPKISNNPTAVLDRQHH